MHLLSGQFLKPKVCIHNRPLFDLSPLISITLSLSVFKALYRCVFKRELDYGLKAREDRPCAL